MEYEKEDEKTGEVKRYEISYSQVLQRRILYAQIVIIVLFLIALLMSFYTLWRIDEMNVFSVMMQTCIETGS